MSLNLAPNWLVVSLRGLLAVLFGCLAFIWPGITLTVLALLFGAYALLDGVFAILAAFDAPAGHDHWWLLLLEGIVGVIIAVMTFSWPGLTALALLYFIAAWAILTGVVEILAAIRLRRIISNEWLFVLSGVLSVLFGMLLIASPVAGALAMIWLIATYAVAFGFMFIALGWRMRKLDPTTPGV